MIKINIPIVRQTSSRNCGPAVLQAIINYYGIVISQRSIAKIVGTTDWGTTIGNVMSFLMSEGFTVTGKFHAKKKDITSILDRKIPIIVLIQDGEYDETRKTIENGHFVVLVGYNEDSVFIMDPLRKDYVEMHWGYFLPRWYDYDQAEHSDVHWYAEQFLLEVKLDGR